VLIYTWMTESAFAMFENEMYWKACYVHTHGYDIVFSDIMSVSGTKKDGSGGWYSDDFMWAWTADIGRFLFSGNYDYVFMTGADALFSSKYMKFPVWAYDVGHDVIIMDQDRQNWGLNENGVLFKPTNFTRGFLRSFYEYRKEFWLQADNGAWMENLLASLGQEREQTGLAGYKLACTQLGMLNRSTSYMFRTNFQEYGKLNVAYSKCFFTELDRLAGPFGQRKSDHIGFTKTFAIGDSNRFVYPEDSQPSMTTGVLPWANCFSDVRNTWHRPQENCFVYHWNGPKNSAGHSAVQGKCPDPSFNWSSSPWNYANRHASAKTAAPASAASSRR